jgi:hypothetical protein
VRSWNLRRGHVIQPCDRGCQIQNRLSLSEIRRAQGDASARWVLRFISLFFIQNVSFSLEEEDAPLSSQR